MFTIRLETNQETILSSPGDSVFRGGSPRGSAQKIVHRRDNFRVVGQASRAHIPTSQLLDDRGHDTQGAAAIVDLSDQLSILQMARNVGRSAIGGDCPEMTARERMLPHESIHGRRQHDGFREIPGSPNAGEAVIAQPDRELR
jgi:hypothetical protein